MTSSRRVRSPNVFGRAAAKSVASLLVFCHSPWLIFVRSGIPRSRAPMPRRRGTELASVILTSNQFGGWGGGTRGGVSNDLLLTNGPPGLVL
eukprot:7455400-Pyramimonas_sp.AAC.1